MIEAINVLVAALRRSAVGSTGVERQILCLLEKILATAPYAADAGAFEKEMDRLHHIWVHSIDWCSALSRQLEKIIMLYHEQADRGTN